MGMPILGIVENMSAFICPTCSGRFEIFQSGGGKKLAEEAGVTFLGEIPIDPTINATSDKSIPFVLANPESPSSKAFQDLVKAINASLEERVH
jgi:nitrogenase subunit NifH